MFTDLEAWRLKSNEPRFNYYTVYMLGIRTLRNSRMAEMKTSEIQF